MKYGIKVRSVCYCDDSVRIKENRGHTSPQTCPMNLSHQCTRKSVDDLPKIELLVDFIQVLLLISLSMAITVINQYIYWFCLWILRWKPWGELLPMGVQICLCLDDPNDQGRRQPNKDPPHYISPLSREIYLSRFHLPCYSNFHCCNLQQWRPR